MNGNQSGKFSEERVLREWPRGIRCYYLSRTGTKESVLAVSGIVLARSGEPLIIASSICKQYSNLQDLEHNLHKTGVLLTAVLLVFKIKLLICNHVKDYSMIHKINNTWSFNKLHKLNKENQNFGKDKIIFF